MYARILTVALTLTLPRLAAADSAVRSRFDLGDVQGILAVQRLDGWLLHDQQGSNQIAHQLVRPEGPTQRPWFYLIPATGQPSVLTHKSEISAFHWVPGRKITYSGHRDLRDGLRSLLAGTTKVAMEYSSKSSIPSLSRVDAATVELVRSYGVTIRSSAELVQFTIALWRADGRLAHYVAAHHLQELRDELLALVADRLNSGSEISEFDLQSAAIAGYRLRGLAGPPPVIASGSNTADPHYLPTQHKHAPIRRGDLLLISLMASHADAVRPIFADLTWMAYAGSKVPRRYERLFKVIAEARDKTISFIDARARKRRAVRGFEADQIARKIIGQAGYAARYLHRTGHSLDHSLYGDGANLDDFETHDTRNLVLGAGFTVEPGIYFDGELGIKTGVDVYLGRSGAEVTLPQQHAITPLL